MLQPNVRPFGTVAALCSKIEQCRSGAMRLATPGSGLTPSTAAQISIGAKLGTELALECRAMIDPQQR
jgi:hypothetical protein